MDCGDDRRFVRQYDVLRSIGVARVGQQTPIHVSPIADIGVVILSRGRLQHFLDKSLSLLGPLEEQLNNRCEDLQLGLDKRSVKIVAYIREEEQTEENSSLKPSTKPPKISPALLIFSAYSPTIQMSAALALGSSNSSMHWHRVGIIPS